MNGYKEQTLSLTHNQYALKLLLVKKSSHNRNGAKKAKPEMLPLLPRPGKLAQNAQARRLSHCQSQQAKHYRHLSKEFVSKLDLLSLILIDFVARAVVALRTFSVLENAALTFLSSHKALFIARLFALREL